MRIHAVTLLAAGSLLALAGCSQARSGPDGSAPRNRNLITREEISVARGWNAYDVIEELRPRFLRHRGTLSMREGAPTRAEVYVDNIHLGPLESLRTINASMLLSIQYLGAVDATTRFGTNHAGGAILIRTR